MIEVSKILVSERLENKGLRHRRSWGAAPVVVWCTTKRCNLNCRHCYSGGAGSGEREFSADEAKRMLEDLAKYGSPFVIFSGGEPFLRDDIFELGRYAKEIGLPVIVSSNGTAITRNKAAEAAKAGFGYVGVSLDGLAETNNSFRGQGDAFDRALQGMRNLRDAGIGTGLRFTMTKLNYRELPEVMELLVREGFHRLCVYHLEYGGRGLELKDHDLSLGDRRRAVDSLLRNTVEINRRGQELEVLTVGNYADAAYLYMKVKEEDQEKAQAVYEHFLRNGGDGSGEKLAYIDERGNVYPSQFLRIGLGNLRETSLMEIWRGDHELLQQLRYRETLLRGRCAQCVYLEICRGGSRARALAVHQDFSAPDPSCYLTAGDISKPMLEAAQHD